MGIFINLLVSRSVKKKEWTKVYKETLPLLSKLNLVERKKCNIDGVDLVCLVPSEERVKKWGWNKEKTMTGWHASADSVTLSEAESYYLPKDIYEDGEYYDRKAGDPILSRLSEYVSSCEDEDHENDPIRLWGDKTQGEPYHISLLAIACLLQHRLRNKVFVYGDINKGQCKQAVSIINKYLDDPIDIPDQCDPERLADRIVRLGLSEEIQIEFLSNAYLGNKDEAFGEFIRQRYSENTCDNYWKKTFEDAKVGYYSFKSNIKNYLLWGFELERLCDLLIPTDEEGRLRYDSFIEAIMNTKMHLKEKDLYDVSERNKEAPGAYSIWTLLGQAFFRGAKNYAIDRYMTLDEIRSALKSKIGDKIDVDAEIDKCLKNEENESESKGKTFRDEFKGLEKELIQNRKDYDISEQSQLMFYEDGDTIEPKLNDALKESFEVYTGCLQEERFRELMAEDAGKRCEWLVKNNRYFMILKEHWEKMFKDIKTTPKSFERYYPAMRLKLGSSDLVKMVIGIMINDDLYEYCRKLIGEDDVKVDEIGDPYTDSGYEEL